MLRAVKVNLKHGTTSKKRAIRALIESYRGAVNFYIRSLWSEQGKLDKETLSRLKNTRLSERYKSQALKQALEIIIATKKSTKAPSSSGNRKRHASLPKFRGCAVLDRKFVSIEKSHGTSFDYWMKLSTLRKGKRVCLPITGTRPFFKWLSKPGAKLLQGCSIGLNKDGTPFVILWVEIPDEEPKLVGESIGVDFGINKLLAFSNGQVLGEGIEPLLSKIDRKKPGSKGKRRSLAERDNYMNSILNLIPYADINKLVIEDLKGLKKGKRPNRSRKFRRKTAAWTVARFVSRLECKCQENRVLLVKVPPAHTSQECPACTHVARENRRDEVFCCKRCGYTDDADLVGAQNILSKYLGSLESPIPSTATRNCSR